MTESNYKIIGKYLNNTQFEIPNADIFYKLDVHIKDYKINLDIKTAKLKDNVFQINTTLALLRTEETKEKITVTVTLATIVEITKNGLSENDLRKIFLISIPQAAYPDLRSTIILLFEKSGFKNIQIEQNIDFEKLYLQKYPN